MVCLPSLRPVRACRSRDRSILLGDPYRRLTAVGAFAIHYLNVVMHECSHNLVLSTAAQDWPLDSG
jgi:hypothetical protein